MKKQGFYITTAIAYPNSRMHVGFGWEVIGSDMVARFHRMSGRPVFFSTGTDEHSQNVEKAAQKAGLSAKVYCDQMASEIQSSMDRMDIAYDRFIRTSDVDHEKVCAKLIEQAFKKGDVYKQKYEGLYCDSCEVFYTEKETVGSEQGPQCPTHKMVLRRVAEENYFFKLSSYESALKKLFSEHPEILTPDFRRNEVLSFVEQGLKDFSVSRTSFKWGIPLPFDREHIIYVWYDALINYLSAIGFGSDDAENKKLFETFWPADVHVIGKDITRFHTVYWPAMLMSAGIPLPKRVWAHGFINLNGEKMSKTRGNIVTPDDVMADFGATALRWYLLAANSFAGDGNYADQDLMLKCNADLSNNMGNLVNRTINMALKYFPDKTPQDREKLPSGIESVPSRMATKIGAKGELLSKAIDEMDLMGYCNRALEFAMSLNKFIDETKPWALAKQMAADPNAAAKDELETVLAQLLEGIRCLGLALWPVIPKASEAILDQLGVGPESSVVSGLWTTSELHSGRRIQVPSRAFLEYRRNLNLALKTPQPLFPRLEIKTSS